MSSATALELVGQKGWKITPSGCWEYQGYCNDDGYAQVRPGGRGGKLVRVSRIVLAAVLGRELKPREVARHTCDNPPCINPDHLKPGTQADNMADMNDRGRHGKAGLTVCVNGHEYPADRPAKIGKNRCLECRRARDERYEARKAARG